MRSHHRYQAQETRQTLREGLEEYRAHEPELLSPSELGDRARDSLLAHDAAHVVFGCDSTGRGEIVLTRWSLFGATDAAPIYLRGLFDHDIRFVFVDFLRKLTPFAIVLGLWDGFRALYRSLFMSRRWPSRDYEAHLDVPLAELRQQFRIRVI